jgi:hypothetical protein
LSSGWALPAAHWRKGDLNLLHEWGLGGRSFGTIIKTNSKADSDDFMGAVRGMSWESPRGPMTINPQTRDVIHNIYFRKVERLNGELRNTEFATVENVKDPVKASAEIDDAGDWQFNDLKYAVIQCAFDRPLLAQSRRTVTSVVGPLLK